MCGAAVKRGACMQMSATQATWAQDASVSELTSFQPYPSQFSTTVGDELMALPPALEVLVPEHETDGSGDAALASIWLDKAATAVAQDLRASTLAIKRLGAKARLILLCLLYSLRGMSLSLINSVTEIFMKQAVVAQAQ